MCRLRGVIQVYVFREFIQTLTLLIIFPNLFGQAAFYLCRAKVSRQLRLLTLLIPHLLYLFLPRSGLHHWHVEMDLRAFLRLEEGKETNDVRKGAYRMRFDISAEEAKEDFSIKTRFYYDSSKCDEQVKPILYQF
jgi:hypothetical protein